MPQVKAWIFNQFNEDGKKFEPGAEVKIQIMRTGERNHPTYWKVSVTHNTLNDVLQNFESRERGIDLVVDENHEPDHKALGVFQQLYMEGKDALFAVIKLTKKGADLLTEWAYKYFSPEIVFKKTDEETWSVQKNLLLWGAFTNRPFFKKMQPLFATEAADTETDETMNTDSILFFENKQPMKTLIEMLLKFAESKTISKDEKVQLSELWEKADESDKTDEMKAHVTEALAFGEDAPEEAPVETDPVEEDEAPTEDAPEEEAPAEDAPVEAAELPDEIKSVQANENGQYVFDETQMNFMKNIVSKAGQMIAEARRTKLESSIKGFAFSETNKKGVILPKNMKEIVDFAVSLNENQAGKFVAIMSKLQAVSAAEVGHNKEGKPVSLTEKEEMKFFTEKLGLNAEEAAEALKLSQKK